MRRKIALRIRARNGYVAPVTIERANSAEIEALALARRSGWPEDMRVLLDALSARAMGAHANLGEMARFWLSRHAMFRELSGTIEQVTEQFPRRQASAGRSLRANSCRGCSSCWSSSTFTIRSRTLHYFPIFRAADARLARGFDVLEGDHHHIHADMARTAETANALLQALQGNADTLRRCGDDYAEASAVCSKGSSGISTMRRT